LELLYTGLLLCRQKFECYWDVATLTDATAGVQLTIANAVPAHNKIVRQAALSAWRMEKLSVAACRMIFLEEVGRTLWLLENEDQNNDQEDGAAADIHVDSFESGLRPGFECLSRTGLAGAGDDSQYVGASALYVRKRT
jgi:hypothetical protein